MNLPLRPNFRFIHQPLTGAQKALFVGRREAAVALANRMAYSQGGAFLVTGYRGVGKTSFVHQTIASVRDVVGRQEDHTEVVDVWINVSRPLRPNELMHHIVRRLREELAVHGVWSRLEADTRRDLEFAYTRTSYNVRFGRERVTGGEVQIGGKTDPEVLNATVKLSAAWKRSLSMDLLAYDDIAAEHDVLQFLQRISSQPLRLARKGWAARLGGGGPAEIRTIKPVIVFDELDKLEGVNDQQTGAAPHPVVAIVHTLKTLLTTSGVCFVLVAGRDLRDRWLSDLRQGDSVFESVFAHHEYVPCLWEHLDQLSERYLDAPASQALPEETSPAEGDRYEREMLSGYLGFKGRGLPRRAVRALDDLVQWHREKPELKVPDERWRVVRFFGGLEEVLRRRRSELIPRTIHPAEHDRSLMVAYYLLDWLLRQAGRSLAASDLVEAMGGLSDQVTMSGPAAEALVARLVSVLVAENYLEVDTPNLEATMVAQVNLDEGPRYRLSPRRLIELEEPPPPTAANQETEASVGAPLAPGVSVSGAVLSSFLGDGGTSEVWAAQDPRLGPVAIKVIKAGDPHTEVVRAIFAREQEVLSRARHPAVVRLLRTALHFERPVMVLELLEGQNLASLTARQGPLSVGQVVHLAQRVASGLHHIHQLGYCRLDVKPSNLIATTDARICIVDVGIALRRSGPDSLRDAQRGLILGSPVSMAPEQWLDGRIDPRTDVYGLGATLYSLLVGKSPFSNDSVGMAFRASVQEPAPRASSRVECPEQLDALIARCLEKDPDARFPSMDEVLKELAKVPTAPGPGGARLAPPPQSALPSAQARSGWDDRRTGAFVPLLDPAKATVPSRSGSGASGSPRLVQLDIDATTELRGRSECRVGRSVESDIQVKSRHLSRFHFRLFSHDESWFVEDFNSANGTWLNGTRVGRPQRLSHGDRIRVGEVEFEFLT
jgi:serine/threonine protein kinase